MIGLTRKKHYFVVALILVSFLFTFVMPAFAQEKSDGEHNGYGPKNIEVSAPPSAPEPPAHGKQENFSPPGQENKGPEVQIPNSPEPPSNPGKGPESNSGQGHQGDNPGKGHDKDNPGKGHEEENQSGPGVPADQGSGSQTPITASSPGSSPGNPDHNEGVGQDPEHSNKVTAAMVPIEKLVVQTLRSDQATVVYPPTKVGGGDGDRWPAVPVGGYVDYRITVTNNSGRALSNVKVWDNPPPHTQYVSSTPALSSTGPGHKLNWIVDLGVGLTVVINLRLRILEKAPKVRTNEAKTEFCSSAVTQVAILEEEGPPPPEKKFTLSIEKSVNKDKAMAGEVLTYTINYCNTGNQPLTEVVISDPISDKAEYVAGTATAGSTLTGSTLTRNIGTLGVGGSGSVSFQVKIKEGASGTVTNVATIDSKETDPKSDDATTQITSPPEILPTAEFNLSILKVVSDEMAKPGDILVYAIHWANTGKSTLTNVVITDAIPAGTTYIEGSATTDHNATVSFQNGILVWKFDKIDPNTNGTYTFNVRINDETRGVVENTAIITSDQVGPQQSTARTTVVAVAPAVFGPPTAPVLVAAPPALLRRVVGALPFTGANLLVYFLSAVFLIGTGIGLQRLK